jgi:hypothetical protein
VSWRSIVKIVFSTLHVFTWILSVSMVILHEIS